VNKLLYSKTIKMVQKIVVHGYEEFQEQVNSPELENKTKYCMFSGDKDEVTGISWCPDCVTYEPVVRKAMEELKRDDAVYIYCLVGGRSYWKDRQNEFRTDGKLMLTGVPTFMQYGTKKKLVEDQLNAAMIEMMLED